MAPSFCRRPERVSVSDGDVTAGRDWHGSPDANGCVGAEGPVCVRYAIVLKQTTGWIDRLLETS